MGSPGARSRRKARRRNRAHSGIGRVHPQKPGEGDRRWQGRHCREGHLGQRRGIEIFRESPQHGGKQLSCELRRWPGGLRSRDHGRRLVSELRLPRVDFIKADIKGATGRLLRGGRGVIARDRPRLAFSMEEPVDDAGGTAALVKEILPGYEVKCGPCLVISLGGNLHRRTLFPIDETSGSAWPGTCVGPKLACAPAGTSGVITRYSHSEAMNKQAFSKVRFQKMVAFGADPRDGPSLSTKGFQAERVQLPKSPRPASTPTRVTTVGKPW